jgi:DNA (cytosine-5)-methyltransferase 1
MTKITFGSVCSGIEAASVAWEPLGFWAEWFSEIEPFPAAVLAHHWPDVPNLGDMLKLPALVAAGEIAAPDILVGGTPCQAFSVAGNRESLADARGGLTLAYVELADAIDRQRAREGQEPCVIVWENVPGVLSTKDNAFGCFLAGLAGEDVPLLPPGKRWTNAGLVLGPKRAVAWRILDAQYFGLAQRRRRVFVVASARNGFDPSAVLLEFDGVRRDSAPRREARQEAATDAGPGFEVAGTLDSRVSGGGFPGSDGAMGGHVGPEKWPAEIGSTLNAHYGSKWGLEDQHINQDAPLFVPAIPILEPGARTGVSTTDVRAGMGVGADGDPMFTLQAGKQHGVAALAFQERGRTDGRALETNGDLAYALTAPAGGGRAQERNVCVSVSGDIAHTLNTANNGKGCSEDGTGRGVPTIAHTVALRGREGGGAAEIGGEVATALRASTGGGDKPHVLAFRHNAQAAQLPTDARDTSVSDSLTCSQQAAAVGMAVRRLTVVECSRLQGFPDDHVRVPYRGKPAADGPRYKALGNSMAVPVMRWIGRRIVRHLNGEI